jgi:hypothetical protein
MPCSKLPQAEKQNTSMLYFADVPLEPHRQLVNKFISTENFSILRIQINVKIIEIIELKVKLERH